ncbi:hypothetical protein F5J12DRAFT_759724 [Pisolithus orientalis]|uniref:uncharacterized protein n=1 Tax=Pisolithus orientalis TaxID=936130 RepID=UPI002223F794|nr:uncharacterized protein F5J12DRAFT_759724 [Pisolithus orientalis]KAI6035043.1 hypothetical protein F5J12DRAFT_759724 [Pisolithus orientalis]
MSESAEKPAEDGVQPLQPQTTSATSAPSDRIELISRARTFLSAPEIRSQDLDAKATFLSEKGLTSSEIDRLLRELPPPIPPRTYPPSPPSALPSLLLGVARVFTWITGSSAIVFLIYYRYLLPRLSKSYEARLALRNHQLSLLLRLRDSAERLKSEQSQSYKEFPRLFKYHEEEPFASFETLDDVIAHVQLSRSSTPRGEVPELTILRCGLTELARSKNGGRGGNNSHDSLSVSTEELISYLESKLPWISGEQEQGAQHQALLWKFLTTCPLFTSSPPPSSESLSDARTVPPPPHPSHLLWKYTPATPPPVPPIIASLSKLRLTLPRKPQYKSDASTVPFMSASQTTLPTPFQRTLQVLSDFTGYITTQTYSLGMLSSTAPSSVIRGTAAAGDSVQEDEIRREIRALKGLVLNRRSFLPTSNGNGTGTLPGGN